VNPAVREDEELLGEQDVAAIDYKLELLVPTSGNWHHLAAPVDRVLDDKPQRLRRPASENSEGKGEGEEQVSRHVARTRDDARSRVGEMSSWGGGQKMCAVVWLCARTS
jgi:hypothetical protein